MKKAILALFFAACAGAASAASSDLSFTITLQNMYENYTIDGLKYRRNTVEGIAFSFSNYNFLDSGDHFGFFESVKFVFAGRIGIDAMAGPAFAVSPSESFRIQIGPGFHIAYSEDSFFIGEDRDSNEAKLNLGLGVDVQMKFTANRRCSPLLGFLFQWDPYCHQEKISSGTATVTPFSQYNRFVFFPYFSFCVNF
ncbi:MAG: hypothetical protein K2H09_06025 [Treponemataceae bacterium]|nr:hypothetical protein [Treponemataceae bacterium]